MAKVTLRAEVKLDEDDYNKILDFANKDDKNPELKDIGKLMQKVLEFNFNNIMQQIAAAEAAQEAGLFGGQRRPRGGHSVSEPPLMQAH